MHTEHFHSHVIRHAAWLLFLLLVLSCEMLQAQFKYEIDPYYHTVAITGYSGPAGDVTIPDRIVGLPVNKINQDAFFQANLTGVTIPEGVVLIDGRAFASTALKHVTIPASVNQIGGIAFASCPYLTDVTILCKEGFIGPEAFFNCPSLTNVVISHGIYGIGQDAFSSCPRLTSITIPSSVTTFAQPVFNACYSLTNIIVAPGSPILRSVDGVLFDVTLDTIIAYPGGKKGDYVVPAGVTNIPWFAFAGCPGLTSVTFPSSVNTLSVLTFYNCYALTELYFLGNNPSTNGDHFPWASVQGVYYLPWTKGWGKTAYQIPTYPWNDPQKSGVFWFSIPGTNNAVFVVEAASDLVNPSWVPIETNAVSGASAYFFDPQWKSYSNRFFRIRWE